MSTTTKLTQRVLDAHGGLARWEPVPRANLHREKTGLLLEIKQQAELLADPHAFVGLHETRVVFEPLGAQLRRRSVYTPSHVAIAGRNDA